MLNDDFWDYFEKRNIPVSEVRSILKESRQVVDYERSMLKTGRYWQITKDEVRSIYSVIRERKPEIVIETGMGSGVSTVSILSAMNDKGKLVSIDPGLPYGKGDREVGFIIPSSMKSNLVYVKGTSSERLEGVLRTLPRLDVFFHDSDHSYQNVKFELGLVWPKIKENPLILIDNYDWSEAAMDFAKEKNLKLRNLADDLALLSR
ncbi:MAG: class I SAM-dependent methyltransferase [Thermoplasmatales archaeon]|nr:class I SAM-dependent methyltransferase [Candidatus Thermoplasmatota archaeon]MDA8054457.1 class I SAM-dependent methyltransferase [Thermoplasmatales archaeon]